MAIDAPLPGIELNWMRPVLPVGSNLIDDAMRREAVEGDGIAEEGSVGIWQAATNLAKNGGAETNVNYLHQDAALPYNAITRVTTQHKFGAACFQYNSTRTNNMSIAYMLNVASGGTLPNDAVPVTAGVTYTLSVWTKIVTPLTEFSPPFQNFGQINWYDAANALISFNQNFTWMPSTAHDWTRWTLTATAPVGAVKAVFFPVIVSNRTGTFFVDGIQFAASHSATPYIETDGATATRAIGRARVSVTVVDETQGWAAFRLRMGHANTAFTTGFQFVWNWYDADANQMQLIYEYAAARWSFNRIAAGSGTAVTIADTFVKGDFITLVIKWTATQLFMSLNGAAFVAAANTTIPALANTLMEIGSNNGTGSSLNGDLFWLAFGSGTLTDADAAAIHAFGNTDPTADDFPDAAVLTGTWGANRGETETFVRYNVYRRLATETEWTRIARIDDPLENTYVDYQVQHAIDYEYAVTSVTLVFGSELESDLQDPPIEASVTFESTVRSFLHSVEDPDLYLVVLGYPHRLASDQAIAYLQVWGKRAPIKRVGSMRARRIGMTVPVPDMNTQIEWQAFLALQDAQRDANATLCYRTAYDGGDLMFCQINPPQRTDQGTASEVQIELQEVDHSLAVS